MTIFYPNSVLLNGEHAAHVLDFRGWRGVSVSCLDTVVSRET